VLSKLKVWIAQLPDRELEVIKPALNGHDLGGVRARLAAIASEISAIESAPEPPPRANIEAYVARLAAAGRPAFRGGQLFWPQHEHATNRAQLTDFSDTDANPLLLEAWLRPKQLAARLYQTRVQECDRPVPLAGRAERLAALHVELEELRYAEAALVNTAISAG